MSSTVILRKPNLPMSASQALRMSSRVSGRAAVATMTYYMHDCALLVSRARLKARKSSVLSQNRVVIAELEKGFAAIERQKEEILALVDGMSEALRSKPYKGGGFKPLDMVHHLVLAEAEQLKEVAKAQER